MIKLQRLSRFNTTLAIALLIGLVGVSLSHLTLAASGSLTLNPSSGGVTTGNNLVVTLHENSGSDAAIGVDAFLDYSSNLEFISATTVAPFSVAPPDNPSGGVVEITRGAYSGVTGDQVVSVITFKALTAGTANVTFNSNNSSISAAASGGANLLVTSPGGNYTLSAPAPAPTPAPLTPAPTPSTPAPSATSKGTSVSVTPQAKTTTSVSSTGTAVTVPDNGAVAVTTPVSVEPATIQSDGVDKVEYYLSGKLVATETKAPYAYNVDTTKLKSGTYNLVNKTYYSNGMVKQTTHKLIVKNTAAHKSFSWWYILIGLILLLGLGVNFLRPVVASILHRLLKRRPPSPPAPTTTGGGTPVSNTGSVVTPSVSAPTAGQQFNNPAPATPPAAIPATQEPGAVFRPHEDQGL